MALKVAYTAVAICPSCFVILLSVSVFAQSDRTTGFPEFTEE
jgi:hypothetical protein